MQRLVLRCGCSMLDIDELVRSTGQCFASVTGFFAAEGCVGLRAVDRDVGQIEPADGDEPDEPDDPVIGLSPMIRS